MPGEVAFVWRQHFVFDAWAEYSPCPVVAIYLRCVVKVVIQDFDAHVAEVFVLQRRQQLHGCLALVLRSVTEEVCDGLPVAAAFDNVAGELLFVDAQLVGKVACCLGRHECGYVGFPDFVFFGEACVVFLTLLVCDFRHVGVFGGRDYVHIDGMAFAGCLVELYCYRFVFAE